MGFCLDGVGRVSVEVRRESFVIHADYGYTVDAEHTPDSDHHGKHWRETPHPEFEIKDLDDLIASLEEAKQHIQKTKAKDKPSKPPKALLVQQVETAGKSLVATFQEQANVAAAAKKYEEAAHAASLAEGAASATLRLVHIVERF